MDVCLLPPGLRNEMLTASHELLTTAEAGTALHVSRLSTYRLCEVDELRWIRICRTRRVSSAEIDRFIADHTESAS
jgi:excisionase family DNA binding protein